MPIRLSQSGVPIRACPDLALPDPGRRIENRAEGSPRYMHFYELDTDNPEPAFRGMAPATVARVGAYGTHSVKDWKVIPITPSPPSGEWPQPRSLALAPMAPTP